MELDSQRREVTWVKIPSHVGILGNKEADSLAELGRLSTPLLAISLANSARKLRHSILHQCEMASPAVRTPVLILISDSESDTQGLP